MAIDPNKFVVELFFSDYKNYMYVSQGICARQKRMKSKITTHDPEIVNIL